jgi:hypothetical protein
MHGRRLPAPRALELMMGSLTHGWNTRGTLLVASVVAGAALVTALPAQHAAPALASNAGLLESRPFHIGERLVYRVRVSRFGTVGRGTMEVEKSEEVRSRATYLLRFDFQTRVGLVTVRDHTRSWLDPLTMTALRFQKQERHPLANTNQSVEIYPAERRWEAANGEVGTSPSDAPLDELSFIYFIRTLPLRPGDEYQFDRHFEAGRNPVQIKVVRRDELAVPAGSFRTIVVEMRVNDQQRFRGSPGVVRLHLSDDRRRIPLQIESTLPVFGAMVLSLESHTHPPDHLPAR